jgi:hypothetical protein
VVAALLELSRFVFGQQVFQLSDPAGELLDPAVQRDELLLGFEVIEDQQLQRQVPGERAGVAAVQTGQERLAAAPALVVGRVLEVRAGAQHRVLRGVLRGRGGQFGAGWFGVAQGHLAAGQRVGDLCVEGFSHDLETLGGDHVHPAQVARERRRGVGDGFADLFEVGLAEPVQADADQQLVMLLIAGEPLADPGRPGRAAGERGQAGLEAGVADGKRDGAVDERVPGVELLPAGFGQRDQQREHTERGGQ